MSIDKGERDLADLAEEQWTDYKSRFSPIEHQFAADQAYDSPARRKQMISGSMANVQNAMATTNTGVNKNLAAAGVNPNSGRGLALTSNISNEMGSSAALGTVGANNAATGRHWAGMVKAMNLGRGQASQSISGLTSSAVLRSQANALKEQTNNAIKSSNYNMYGNLAGMAAGAGMYYAGGRRRIDENRGPETVWT